MQRKVAELCEYAVVQQNAAPPRLRVRLESESLDLRSGSRDPLEELLDFVRLETPLLDG